MRLLCICLEFPPDTTPTAIRTEKLLARLPADWEIDVVTIERPVQVNGRYRIHVAPLPPESVVVRTLRRGRLEKLVEYVQVPDDKRRWVTPALTAARQVMARHRPDVIVAFMMPYASGLVGEALKRETGLPLVLNFDDSPTCSDMHPSYPSSLHYRLVQGFEQRLLHLSDAAIYVSHVNLQRVRQRASLEDRDKLHLVRYGVEPRDFPADGQVETPPSHGFNIVYIGGMSGWYRFYHPGQPAWPRRVMAAWNRLGRYHQARVDESTSSPVFVARAIQQTTREHPVLAGRIKFRVYGNRYAEEVVNRVLQNENIADVVEVNGPIPNRQAIQLARQADLLFMALPDRPDGDAGGRISAKTYEYLMTDRPILAALPPGENRDFMKDWPGVFMVKPDDVAGMQRIVTDLATRKAAGEDLAYDRSGRLASISYEQLAKAFREVIERVARKEG